MADNRTRHAPEALVRPISFEPRRPEYWSSSLIRERVRAEAQAERAREELRGDVVAIKLGTVLAVIVGLMMWATPFVVMWWRS